MGVVPDGAWLRAQLRGELVLFTSPALLDRVGILISPGEPADRAGVGAVTFCDSHGLNALVRLWKCAIAARRGDGAAAAASAGGPRADPDRAGPPHPRRDTPPDLNPPGSAWPPIWRGELVRSVRARACGAEGFPWPWADPPNPAYFAQVIAGLARLGSGMRNLTRFPAAWSSLTSVQSLRPRQAQIALRGRRTLRNGFTGAQGRAGRRWGAVVADPGAGGSR